MLTREVLEGIAPRPKAAGDRQRIWDAYVACLTSRQMAEWLVLHKLNRERRIEHALAQWAWESGGFTIIWESGNYSQKQIMNIFGVGRHSAKVTVAESKRLAHNGYALFERVYGVGNPKKAKELGNLKPGDGYNCRGWGIQQLTGLAAQVGYAARMGLAREDMVKRIDYSILGAILEWNDKGCSPLADRDDIRGITKRINGGYNGYDGRVALWRKAQRLVRPEAFKDVQADGLAVGAVDKAANGEVLELQQLLVGAGYPCPVDGDFGNLTERQLAAFQAQQDLPVTKRADKATLAALREAQQDTESKTPKTEVRNVELADLREGGSVQVAVHDNTTWAGRLMKRFGWGTETVGGGGMADHQLGLLDQAESLVSNGQRAKGVAANAQEMIFGLPPHLVVYALLMVVGGMFIFGGYYLIRNSRLGLADRLESARSGANLST